MKKEEIIREQRTIEAMRKGYMGSEGKFGHILKTLGEPIVKEGSPYFEQSYLDDYWVLDEDEIRTADDEEVTFEIGWHFDGLSRGINLTIQMLDDRRELTVRHEGRIVYREIAGDLYGYAPDPAWEDHIERLYNQAKKREKERRQEEKKLIQKIAKKRQQETLDYLRDKWGL